MAAEGAEAGVAEALNGLVAQAVQLGFVDTVAEALNGLVAQAVEPGFVDTESAFFGIAASQIVSFAHWQTAGLPLMLLDVLVVMLRVVLHAILGIE